MNYNDFISSMQSFVAVDKDICRNILGLSADMFSENIIISPGWEPWKLGITNAKLLVESSPLFGFRIWKIVSVNLEITYIKTGFGAPMMMDAMLPLGITKCRKIIFVSSVGGLSAEIGIGDLVIPKYSICGDGASRYIASDDVHNDVFGEKIYADKMLFCSLKSETERICKDNNVKHHIGRTFCTDTICAQFPHINKIVNMNCNSIDMESAVAFRTAKLMNIPIAALLNVSDNSVIKKSLMSKERQTKNDYLYFVRREIMAKIIFGVFR